MLQSFEEGKTANMTRETVTNTSPLVTCNGFLLRPLQSHGFVDIIYNLVNNNFIALIFFLL